MPPTRNLACACKCGTRFVTAGRRRSTRDPYVRLGPRHVVHTNVCCSSFHRMRFSTIQTQQTHETRSLAFEVDTAAERACMAAGIVTVSTSHKKIRDSMFTQLCSRRLTAVLNSKFQYRTQRPLRTTDDRNTCPYTTFASF